MSFLDLAKKRCSTRAYQPVPVSQEHIDAIVEAARVAPTAANRHVDASILTDHMMLAATDLGLGSVWICRFDPTVIREEFGLPETLVPVNILAVGHPAGELKSPDRHATERIPTSELVIHA